MEESGLLPPAKSGRFPSVYFRAGVATTFSPRFRDVLAEAGRVSGLFDVPLHLIHAAEESSDKLERFRDTLRSLELPETAPIHFKVGPPAQAILQIQAEQQIDLLIAGALEQESVHRNFTGDVARALLREAACDLFLFVEPKENTKAPEHIFVAIPDFTDFSRDVFQRSVDFAERIGTKKLTLVHVQTTFAEAKEKALGTDVPSAHQNLEMAVAESPSKAIEIDTHSVRGNTGFTACEFIQSNGADLLILPSQIGEPGQPIFAPALDWIIQVIPTNVWVIRRVYTEAGKQSEASSKQ
jgi:nucleotide-binding universal stress UspA family protein